MLVALSLELHPGEAEAIALTIELRAGLLLMDERKGRSIASRLGCKTVGVLGVLMEAKHTGCIFVARPILDDLVGKAGCWISQDLYKRILQVDGE